MFDSTINEAIEAIKAEGLNSIRCSLTGAPYATLNDSDIREAMRAELAVNPLAESDALVDSWYLRALTFNSNPCPALRNAKSVTLSVIRGGEFGEERAVTYFLSRLFFPAFSRGNGYAMTSTQAINRMTFSARIFDTLVANRDAIAAHKTVDAVDSIDQAAKPDWIQSLAACDSYCSLTRWHEIQRWKDRRAPFSIHAKRNRETAALLNDPDLFTADPAQIDRLINSLLNLLVDVAGKESKMPAAGNDMALDLFTARAESLPVPKPKAARSSSKQEAKRVEDEAAQADWYKSLSKASQSMFAWSATHGKGHIMGSHPEARKPKSKSKARAAKPKSKKVQALMQAMDSLGGLKL